MSVHTTEQLNSALAGRYVIERRIGEGGMATVYLARDLRHDRQVAVKVLKPELGAVLGAERFLAEIKVTANLQHPNLLPLFDSGEAGGLLYYVMPFVEGESLRARIDREKQLPIDEAVRIAVAVASALGYAHERGVIHRDLKPENILLQAGQPVVADFGIALAVSKAGGTRVTQTGLSLGTPQYMSPEQASGDRAIDGRSDIYSLAALTYEMIGGEPPHSGTTAQAIIAKLLTAEPAPLSSLRGTAPVHLEAALARGLAKLPADRFSTAQEFADALTGARPVASLGRTGVASTAARVPAVTRTRTIFEVALGVVALAGVVGTVFFATRASPGPVSARFTVDLPGQSEPVAIRGAGLALSRDGTRLAVVVSNPARDSTYIVLRSLDDPMPLVVPGPSDVTTVTFSPDGTTILYTTFGAMYRVPVTGGTPQQVVSEVGPVPPSWGERDQILYAYRGALWLVSADGGGRRRVFSLDSSAGRLAGFEILPGGRHALLGLRFGRAEPDSLVIRVLSLDDGTLEPVGVEGAQPHYVLSGHLLFTRTGGVLYAAPFSLRTRRVTGDAVRLLDGVITDRFDNADVAVADNGTIAFLAGITVSENAAMYIVTHDGQEQRVEAAQASYREPRISPDGSRVVVRIGVGPDDGNLWTYELATGARLPLSTDGSTRRGEWTRDGRSIVHMRHSPSGPEFIVSRPADLSSDEVTVATGTPDGKGPALQSVSLGPAGTFAAIRIGSRSAAEGADIWIAPVDSIAAMRPLLTSPAIEVDPRVSPDGRFLAYTSEESGAREVYVTPLPGPGPRVPVSVGGGTEAMWGRDATTLYYRGNGRMMAAKLELRPQLRVTRRDSLFADIYFRYTGFQSYDVFPDGERFLMTRSEQLGNNAPRVSVVLNWRRLLGSRSADDR